MNKHQGFDAMVAEAARYSITLSRPGGKHQWQVKCARCGRPETVIRHDIQNVPQIVDHFHGKNWVITKGEPAFCDTPHYREYKAAKKEERISAVPALAPPTATAIPVIGPDFKSRYDAGKVIEEYWDREKQRYKDGKTDKSVGELIGRSEEFIVSVRLELVGELAEDPEITALRDEARAIDSQQKELDAFISKFAEEASQRQIMVTNRLSDLAARIDGLAKQKKAASGAN